VSFRVRLGRDAALCPGTLRSALDPHTILTRPSPDSERADSHPSLTRISPDPHPTRTDSRRTRIRFAPEVHSTRTRPTVKPRSNLASGSISCSHISLKSPCAHSQYGYECPSQVARGRRVSELARSIQVVSKGPRASDLRQGPAAPSWLKGSGPSLTWAPRFGFRAGLAEMIE
jgi:hypothetical protein